MQERSPVLIVIPDRGRPLSQHLRELVQAASVDMLEDGRSSWGGGGVKFTERWGMLTIAPLSCARRPDVAQTM